MRGDGPSQRWSPCKRGAGSVEGSTPRARAAGPLETRPSQQCWLPSTLGLSLLLSNEPIKMIKESLESSAGLWRVWRVCL